MPPRIPRPCRFNGCPKLTSDRAGYCDAHKNTGWTDHQRGLTTTQRGYGADWEKLKPTVLKRDHYLCQPCKRDRRAVPAQEVDHITAKADGGTNALTNLESICTACHTLKTSQDKLKRRR